MLPSSSKLVDLPAPRSRRIARLVRPRRIGRARPPRCRLATASACRRPSAARGGCPSARRDSCRGGESRDRTANARRRRTVSRIAKPCPSRSIVDVEDRALAIPGPLVALEQRAVGRADLDGAQVAPDEMRSAHRDRAQSPGLVLDAGRARFLGAIASSASRRRRREASTAAPARRLRCLRARARRLARRDERERDASEREPVHQPPGRRLYVSATIFAIAWSDERQAVAVAASYSHAMRCAQPLGRVGLGEAEPEQRAGAVGELCCRRPWRAASRRSRVQVCGRAIRRTWREYTRAVMRLLADRGCDRAARDPRRRDADGVGVDRA